MSEPSCLICGGRDMKQVIDLGKQPNGNVFPALHDLGAESTFECIVVVCPHCWLVQLQETPSVEDMFTDHPYISGLNRPVVEHFEYLALRTVEKFSLQEQSLVLDIGANDGTLLSKFQNHRMRVIGIDPCVRACDLARHNGITVMNAFWNTTSARSIIDLGLRPDVITATAVFYHMHDIHDFVRGLEMIMQRDTVFCVQCVYLKDVIEKLQFDHFYHEHTMIHAIAPLERLFSDYGLRIVDIEFTAIHGGSFIMDIVREESPFPSNSIVSQSIKEEREAGLQSFQTYLRFTSRVEKVKQDLLTLLRELRDDGKIVYGLGAPLKGSTLLNYCGIGPDLIALVTEINPNKIGRYTPGSNIPIFSEEEVTEQPDYYLILSWNFLHFFVKKYASYFAKGGRFIVPHPELRIVDSKSDPNRFALPR